MKKHFYKFTLKFRWFFKIIDIFRNILLNEKSRHLILEYHSVGANVEIELDISVEVFEQHLRYLGKYCNVINLTDYLRNEHSRNKLGRPVVVLTFDDGYDNFYTKVLPLLKKYELPATLFPALKFIDEPANIPIKSSIGNWKDFSPISVDNLKTILKCPLIDIQSHGYAHLDFSTISKDEAIEDILKSNSWLKENLDVEPTLLAYPRGLMSGSNLSVVKKYFKYALIADYTELNCYEEAYVLPRIPILRTDKFFWFKLKVKGVLFREQGLFKWVIRMLNL